MKHQIIKLWLTVLINMVFISSFGHDIAVANAGKTIYYTFTNNNTELAVSYSGTDFYSVSAEYSGNVVIPESVTYNGKVYSVTSIGQDSFNGCYALTSITIPNSVTSIGQGAFLGCSHLTSITIPNSVTLIGGDAFTSTGWYDNQPDGVVYAGKVAYRYKGSMPSNSSITIEDGTLGIGSYAFSNRSNLTSITIPNSVETIGQYAFRGCESLTSINIPDNVTSIGDYAFAWCSKIKYITLGKNVRTIGDNAFYHLPEVIYVRMRSEIPPYHNSFNSEFRIVPPFLYVPEGCKQIYETNNVWGGYFANVLEYKNITFVDENVKVLVLENWDKDHSGDFSTDEAEDIISLGTVFKSNKDIKSFDELQYFTHLSSIDFDTFYGCNNLTSLTIPESVTRIAQGAFLNFSNLTSIIVKNGNKQYDSRNNCNAIIETSTNSLIAGCMSTVIPNSVTSIGNSAFYGCSGLTSVTIPNSVTSIGNSAFYGCSGMTSVTIPNSVTSIGEEAFRGCTGTLIVNCNIPNTYHPDTISSGITYSPFFESSFSNIIIGNGVTSIGDNAFYSCSDLISVTIPNSVTRIGLGAFRFCSGLTSVTIPNSVTTIGDKAFQRCSSLTSVTIPNSVTKIGSYTFAECSSLSSVSIPNSVTSIGECAFWNCKGLTSIKVEKETPIPIEFNTFSDYTGPTLYVPNCSKTEYQATVPWGYFHTIVEYEEEGIVIFADKIIRNLCVQNWDAEKDGKLSFEEAAAVTNLGTVFSGITTNTSFDELQYFTGLTSIGEKAFYNSSGLTSITIPNSVTTIYNKAFQGCSSLTSVTIPNNMTWIGSYTFAECSSLTSVSIPNSVTTIGDFAFSGCSSLTSATIPNSVTSIKEGAFKDCSSLTSATIPNNVTTIGDYAFEDCHSLTSLTIPNSLTSIGKFAFRNCSNLQSVTFPNVMTKISFAMFSGCSGLTSINIPKSVTSIGNYAFEGCSGLTSVKVGRVSPLSIANETFTNRFNAILYVPKGSKTTYQRADYWNEFKKIVEFPNPDVNQDNEVDVVDAVDIARFVVGTPSETFVEFLADINSDDYVNVADAVVLVNEISGDVNFAKAYGAQSTDIDNEGLTLTTNSDHSLSLSMESQRQYTAFQFDLMTNNNTDVMDMALNTARKNGHKLLFNKVGEDRYRVVVLSVANNGFNGTAGELLNIQFDSFDTDELTISNIHFITSGGTDYRFDDLTVQGETTIISNPEKSTEVDQPRRIYDLSGRQIFVPSVSSETTVLPKGVYIVNGRKVIVK